MSTYCQIFLESPSPVYTGGDTVAGYLEVNSASDDHFNVAILFEGNTRTWLSYDKLEEHVYVVPTTEYQFFHEKQSLKTSFQHLHFFNGKPVYHFPFEFTIPVKLTSSKSENADILPKFLEIPPTSKEGSILQKDGKFYMQPLISYVIKASVHSTNLATAEMGPAICSEEKEIVVEPMVEPKLSLETKDAILSCSKLIKRHSWSQSLGELSIEAEEPSPLNISTSNPLASTILPLTLTFHPSQGILNPLNPDCPTWTFEITTSIQCNTFFSTHKFTNPPTIASAKEDLYTGLRSVTTKPEVLEFQDLEWRTWRECLCLDGQVVAMEIKKNPCWTTVLKIPIITSEISQPNYLSMFSARKYVLVVKVRVRDSGQVLELEVPLQVVNNFDELEQKHEGDLLDVVDMVLELEETAKSDDGVDRASVMSLYTVSV